MSIKVKNVFAYAKNGNRKVSIKHECEYCNHHTCEPNKFDNGLLEVRCELDGKPVFYFDPFAAFEGKYYGLGLPNKKHYVRGMLKKSHECKNFSFDTEGLEIEEAK